MLQKQSQVTLSEVSYHKFYEKEKDIVLLFENLNKQDPKQ